MRERTPFPTADEIAARAHELFASGGRRVSLIPEYWRTAERELLAGLPSRSSPDYTRERLALAKPKLADY